MAKVAPEPAAGAAPDQERMEDKSGTAMKSAAYLTLISNGLICNDFMVDQAEALETMPGTWDVTMSMIVSAATLPLCCHLCCTLNVFVVNPGCVRTGMHADGRFLFWGPGVHVRNSLWHTVDSGDRQITGEPIIHGTKAIITVDQGFVGLAIQQGQPVLLPPGLHQWDSPTMVFKEIIDLSSKLIKMGPYTLVTVDQGYAAITQDNGKQKVLEGGKSYMLTHQNWKFELFLTQKMQTETIGPVEVSTGDNIALRIVANASWLVADAVMAASRNVDTKVCASDSLKILREDVVRQVTSSLASLVGSIQYGVQGNAGLVDGTEHGRRAAASSASADDDGDGLEPEPERHETGRKALFDPQRLRTAVEHANNICARYGVEVLSINLISANPADEDLQQIMSRGAIAAVTAEETGKAARAQANATLIGARAEAEKANADANAKLIRERSDAEVKKIRTEANAEAELISARSSAQAAKIKAEADAEAELISARSNAEAVKIKAQADAEAERVRGEGAKEAGHLIEESHLACEIAKLKIAYSPFSEVKSSTYFFGLQGPGELPNALLGNALASQMGAASGVAHSALHG